jgi:hypothetical protein
LTPPKFPFAHSSGLATRSTACVSWDCLRAPLTIFTHPCSSWVFVAGSLPRWRMPYLIHSFYGPLVVPDGRGRPSVRRPWRILSRFLRHPESSFLADCDTRRASGGPRSGPTGTEGFLHRWLLSGLRVAHRLPGPGSR